MFRSLSIRALTITLFTGISAMAQNISFSEAIKMGESINSEAEEIAPLLSPDGDRLYFVRVFSDTNTGGKFSGSDIWYANRDESYGWAFAGNNLNGYNTNDNNAVIGIHENGDILYLLNTYGKKGGIAFSKLLNGKWTEPEEIPISGLKTDDFVGFYMNSDYSVLLVSMKGKDTYGEEDLYVCLKDESGRWQAPKNLGPTINTSGFEISPFLSKDGLRLYFASNEHSGYGDADIFVSERKYGVWDVWTTPSNLGPRINTTRFDAYFSVYDSIYYLSSNREGELANIFSGQVKKGERDENSRIEELVEETQRLLSQIALDVEENRDLFEILFEENSTRISDSEVVDNLYQRLNNDSSAVIQLTYSARAISSDDDLILNSRRAESFRNQMTSRGIGIERVIISSNDKLVKDPTRLEGEPLPAEQNKLFAYLVNF